MNKREFIKQLRSTAEVLKPLTLSVSSGSSTWDGTSYAKASTREPNPYALAWFSILGTIADLIETQESNLSSEQFAYLERVLFGGMGSLNDLAFDPKSLGDIAISVNERLDQSRQSLFSTFSKWKI